MTGKKSIIAWIIVCFICVTCAPAIFPHEGVQEIARLLLIVLCYIAIGLDYKYENELLNKIDSLEKANYTLKHKLDDAIEDKDYWRSEAKKNSPVE